MKQYRKIPLVIRAEQFTGTSESANQIITWMTSYGGKADFFEHLMDGELIAHPDPYMRIFTLEGIMIASPGDWVIKGVQDEFYPCKPDIFAATYEPVQ